MISPTLASWHKASYYLPLLYSTIFCWCQIKLLSRGGGGGGGGGLEPAIFWSGVWAPAWAVPINCWAVPIIMWLKYGYMVRQTNGHTSMVIPICPPQILLQGGILIKYGPNTNAVEGWKWSHHTENKALQNIGQVNVTYCLVNKGGQSHAHISGYYDRNTR